MRYEVENLFSQICKKEYHPSCRQINNILLVVSLGLKHTIVLDFKEM